MPFVPRQESPPPCVARHVPMAPVANDPAATASYVNSNPLLAMKLVQIFLPLYDNQGQPFPKALFDQVRESLVQRFGGVTAFVRSPAVGVWEDDAGALRRDDVVLFEVLADAVERDWWRACRHTLEKEFSQQEVLIRVTEVEII